jgi:hypothetical protein
MPTELSDPPAFSPPYRSYTVTERGNCVLVFGAVPPQVFQAIAKPFPKGAVLDPHVARLAKANFAMGLREDLEALRIELEPAARRRIEDWPLAQELSPAAREWLAVGHQGQSACVAFYALTGVRPSGMSYWPESESQHPVDPGDLGRFLALLEAVPEFADRIDRLRDLSPHWNILVEHLAELRDLLRTETASHRRENGGSGETGRRMRDLGL